MQKLLALLFALLAGSAFAAPGFWVDGRCYATTAEAGDALALRESKTVPTFQVVSSTLYVRGVHSLVCARSASTATAATIQCSSIVSGSTSTTSNGAQTAFTQIQAGVGGFNTVFPTCQQSETLTAADGVALGWQVGGIWIAVAAVLFMAAVIKRFT